MPRRRVSGYAVAVAVLVGVSALFHWLAGRRVDGLWVMPDEAIYAERALRFWHEGSLPVLNGQGAGYSVLYPLLVAYPLSLAEHGDWAVLKVAQAVVVSLAAVPVYLYGRRIMPRRHTLVAAALTLCSPLLLYSGLVMTEVLFYPVAALALLAVANAVATGRLRDQTIALALIAAAVLTRVQAVAFVAVFAGAAAADVLVRRERSRARAFWPVWVVVALAAGVAFLAPSAFGAYASAVGGSYPFASSLGLTFDHLAYIALSTGIFPALALVVCVTAVVRGQERDPRARALVLVTACAVLVVCVQVGFFAARYSHHVLGRDLAALPPLLFLVLALWVSRGAPRALVASIVGAFCLFAVLTLTPWDRLTSAAAFPDSFGLDVLNRIHSLNEADVVSVVALVALALGILLPRRFALVFPVLVAAALVTDSVLASNDIRANVTAAQSQLVGQPRDWIERVATSPVAYLYDGETYWNSVWQQRFWNPRIDRAYTIAPSTIPGPLPQRQIVVAPDGRLPITERYVAAPDTHVLQGTAVAHVGLVNADIPGLTLWRLEGPPRLSLVEHGFLPNGDMTGPATVTVYDCAGGTLLLTLLPKETRALTILLDGKPIVHESLAGQSVWRGRLRVPASHPRTPCVFTISGQTLLGSTQVLFER